MENELYLVRDIFAFFVISRVTLLLWDIFAVFLVAEKKLISSSAKKHFLFKGRCKKNIKKTNKC